MKEFRILSTTAILGYGFPVSSFEAGMAKKPHLVAVDAGSSDPGPYYLGAGLSFTDRSAVKRDLEIMLCGAMEHDIPVIIGSAGGSGGEPHVAWCRDIIEEIARKKGLHFKLAVIQAQIDKELVRQKLGRGAVHPLSPAPELTEKAIDDTVRIVAQMGLEPMAKALEEGAQVVLAGRAYDPSVFAAMPVMKGFDKGLAIHLGKILECAAIASTPGSGSDCMFGTLYEDSFVVETLNPARKCTTVSVAAHTLYEKTNPYVLPGPGGVLDLRETTFEQETENAVRVRGSKFVPGEKYTVKLEGVKLIGYRTVAIAGARDPIMIEKIDDIIAGVKERVSDNFKGQQLEYYLDFKVYGKNGVMGALEPVYEIKGHELGIIIEAVAPTQKQADTICSFARSTMLHYGYEGRRATAGNLALPYSPSDFHAGEVYTFSMYHVMDVDDACEPFPIVYATL